MHRARPELADCYRYLARAHVAIGDRAAAVADLTRLLELKPDDATIYAGRAMMQAAQGKREEAVRDLRMTLRLKPDFEEAKQALKRLGAEP